MALLLLSALQLQLVLLPSALGATAPAPPQLPDAIATSPAGTFKGFTENGTNVSRAPTETNRNQPKRLRPATPLLGAAVATREMPPLRPPVQVWRGIPYADPPVGKLRWMPVNISKYLKISQDI
eukprot:SAG31_NODE_143_length_22627_cov_14.541347_4_plen_124_part_00